MNLDVSDLILPGNRNAACGHFAVERLVFRLQLHTFHCGELLDVQHVFTVDGLRLWKSTNTQFHFECSADTQAGWSTTCINISRLQILLQLL